MRPKAKPLSAAVSTVRGDPRNAREWIALGRALEERGSMAKAERAYEAAVRVAPQDAEACIALGRLCQRLRFHEKAEDHLRRAVRLSGGAGQARLFLGEFLESRGKYKEAVRWMTSAASRGSDPIVHFKIGWLQGLRGEHGRMRRHFRRFVDSGSGRGGRSFPHFIAFMGLQDYRRAFDVAQVLSDAPRAVDLERLPRPWPEPDTWLHPDALDKKTRNHYLRQLKALEAWSRRNSSSPWPGFFKGCIYWRLYRFEEALREMSGVRRLPAERYGWMRYFTGMLRLTLRRYPRAREDFEGALATVGGFWQARCSLAETLLCLGERRAAFAEFDRAAAGEDRAEVWAWRGEALLWLGRYRDALGWLDRAVDAGAWLAFGWRGAARMLLGDFEGSLEDLDKAVAHGPRDAESYAWRGELMRRLGRHDRALSDLDRSIEMSLSAPWARVNRALVRSAMGEPAAMRSDFDRLPSGLVAHVLRASGLPRPKTDSQIEAVLREALKLAGGVRRDEAYLQDLWMRGGRAWKK